jgi:hypothetical protein
MDGTCGLSIHANDVLNLPAASAFAVSCDAYMPGTQCAPPTTIETAITITITATEALVYSALQNNVECCMFPLTLNQKYKITSSTSGMVYSRN